MTRRGLRLAVWSSAAVSLALSLACRRTPAAASGVVLSYEERPGMCANCPHFRVEFRDTGLVAFHGISGCAVPCESSYRIPAEEFTELLRHFHAAGFFERPRTLPWTVTDSTRVTVAYRDDQRIHETVRLGQPDPALTALAERMRLAARADALMSPSLAKYEALDRARWDVN